MTTIPTFAEFSRLLHDHEPTNGYPRSVSSLTRAQSLHDEAKIKQVLKNAPWEYHFLAALYRARDLLERAYWNGDIDRMPVTVPPLPKGA